MKKLLLSLGLVFGVTVTPVIGYNSGIELYSEEPSVTVVEENVDVPSTDEETVSTSEEVSEEKQSGWAALTWKVVSLLVALLSGVAVVAFNLGIKKLEKKLGFDVPDAVEVIAESYVVKGINKTENWAKAKSEKPASDDKLAQALSYAADKAAEHKAVKEYIDSHGKELVEKLLKSDETPDEATPKRS